HEFSPCPFPLILSARQWQPDHPDAPSVVLCSIAQASSPHHGSEGWDLLEPAERPTVAGPDASRLVRSAARTLIPRVASGVGGCGWASARRGRQHRYTANPC